ncbi:phosphoadenosine phosphosulfate reductase family protein, partial [Enterobacter hormaechei]|nr:phosphoadenosine phosphosulfate reductase family protein [Enterobacter hormaechei]
MSEAPMIIVPTDIGQKIKEIESAYQRYVDEFRIPEDHKIIVNFSAGKDSTATMAIAHALFGDKVQGVMADTDNEHELTIEFGKTIHEQIGCKPISVVKRVYSEEHFSRRREAISSTWTKRQAIRMGSYRGIIMPSLARSDTKFGKAWQRTAEKWGIEFQTPLEAALSVLHPSGNSFLDACLLHGKFPQLRDRFCTDELKIQIAFDAVMQPMLDDGEVIVQWSGVRA